MFAAEYGTSRNLMTPRRLGIGALPGGAYELSTGTGIENEPIWGVTVVRLNQDGTTRRDFDASTLFQDRGAALDYIQQLKEKPRP
jgi:hypothetical protein